MNIADAGNDEKYQFPIEKVIQVIRNLGEAGPVFLNSIVFQDGISKLNIITLEDKAKNFSIETLDKIDYTNREICVISTTYLYVNRPNPYILTCSKHKSGMWNITNTELLSVNDL